MGKVGRNDSCPCGSGAKYKKCCGDSLNIARAADKAAKDANVTKSPLVTSANLKKLRNSLSPKGIINMRISETHYVHISHDKINLFIAILERNEANGLKPEEYDLSAMVKECGCKIKRMDEAA